MSFPWNITNPGILIANLPTSQEAQYLTNLVLAGGTASENDVLTWKSGAPSWEVPTGGGVTDHGALTGLADDDHTQYHTDARGDARYYTKTLLDSGQLDTRYYTETEIDTLLTGKANTSHTHTASQITDFSTAADARIAAAAGVSIASLSGGKIPTSQLPALALTDVFSVASQVAQLALTAEEGDVAIRTDQNKSYIHNGGVSGTMADWSELLTPTDTVLSVNGKTGAVTITLADVTDVTASAAELNILDGATVTTAELNILDGVTATASELNVLDGITATVTELNYTDGVTSNIQTQLNAKKNTADERKSVSIQLQDGATDLATGDGAAYFMIPAELNTWILTGVRGAVTTAGTTGTTDFQIHNVTDAVDMLSTKLTIDSTETSSATAATAAVINTANDEVATNDVLRIDVDAVSTTKPKGGFITLTFSPQ